MKTMSVLFPSLFTMAVIALSGTATLKAQFPEYPQIKIAVFSDPHFYDPSLGMEGKAFRDYIADDRKLLKDSKEIMETAISEIEKSDAGLVFVTGDLTKDGEKFNHLKMAEYLHRLESSGKKVFVVPGNHDIKNPDAYKYFTDKAERVPNITADEFTEIYSDFGFAEAIKKDPGSLSYVCEPLPGLWILGLDACRYRENPETGHPVTSGKFSKESIKWIGSVLAEAKSSNKAVITLIHHGVVEHYKKQHKFYGEYLVDDYKEIAEMLAENGARVAFTGHFHAQDMSIRRFKDGAFILDVETGSMVTYPCPYRIVTINSNQDLDISSHFIQSIPSHPDFQKYAREFVHSGLAGIAANTLIGMGVDSAESWSLSGQVADAFLAHYRGDEVSPAIPLNLKGISFKGRFLISFKKGLVKTLFIDLEPADNEYSINLRLPEK
jgi:hypothetical protein